MSRNRKLKFSQCFLLKSVLILLWLGQNVTTNPQAVYSNKPTDERVLPRGLKKNLKSQNIILQQDIRRWMKENGHELAMFLDRFEAFINSSRMFHSGEPFVNETWRSFERIRNLLGYMNKNVTKSEVSHIKVPIHALSIKKFLLTPRRENSVWRQIIAADRSKRGRGILKSRVDENLNLDKNMTAVLMNRIFGLMKSIRNMTINHYDKGNNPWKDSYRNRDKRQIRIKNFTAERILEKEIEALRTVRSDKKFKVIMDTFGNHRQLAFVRGKVKRKVESLRQKPLLSEELKRLTPNKENKTVKNNSDSVGAATTRNESNDVTNGKERVNGTEYRNTTRVLAGVIKTAPFPSVNNKKVNETNRSEKTQYNLTASTRKNASKNDTVDNRNTTKQKESPMSILSRTVDKITHNANKSIKNDIEAGKTGKSEYVDRIPNGGNNVSSNTTFNIQNTSNGGEKTTSQLISETVKKIGKKEDPPKTRQRILSDTISMLSNFKHHKKRKSSQIAKYRRENRRRNNNKNTFRGMEEVTVFKENKISGRKPKIRSWKLQKRIRYHRKNHHRPKAIELRRLEFSGRHPPRKVIKSFYRDNRRLKEFFGKQRRFRSHRIYNRRDHKTFIDPFRFPVTKKRYSHRRNFHNKLKDHSLHRIFDSPMWDTVFPIHTPRLERSVEKLSLAKNSERIERKKINSIKILGMENTTIQNKATHRIDTINRGIRHRDKLKLKEKIYHFDHSRPINQMSSQSNKNVTKKMIAIRKKRFDYEDVYNWDNEEEDLDYSEKDMDELEKFLKNWHKNGVKIVVYLSVIVSVLFTCFCCVKTCCVMCGRACLINCQLCYDRCLCRDPMYRRFRKFAQPFGLKLSYSEFKRMRAFCDDYARENHGIELPRF